MEWNASKKEWDVIGCIARRAVQILQDSEPLPPQKASDLHRTILMDIVATHCNGCRLQLDELLAAPRFDFSHDVFGIYRHINRETGELQDCFLPRYAA